jgi:Leucine-rich repeat (LRR) protein
MSKWITENWIRERVGLTHDVLEDVRSLSLPGTYHEKISRLGRSLRGFTRLKNLDLSRNAISNLEGLEQLPMLETLNLYYNNIPDLKELFRLRHNVKLKVQTPSTYTQKSPNTTPISVSRNWISVSTLSLRMNLTIDCSVFICCHH